MRFASCIWELSIQNNIALYSEYILSQVLYGKVLVVSENVDRRTSCKSLM